MTMKYGGAKTAPAATNAPTVRRGWCYQTLTAWVVVPVNYFWRPQFDVNWARGPFFRDQHEMPGLLYLLGYLVVVPQVVYFPTHLLLQWWARRGGFLLAGGRGIIYDVRTGLEKMVQNRR